MGLFWGRVTPGNPDIVLPKYKKVIFVHGCFWHGHEGCPRAKKPSSNTAFWNEKLSKNIKRDRINQQRLRDLGWDPITVWQCEIKKGNLEALSKRLVNLIINETD